ncbi:hypothetical protein PT974_06785 [Cladobotryum mycophilum]|uniref:GDP/GTP exchange factor Sec2 N-terminal domain-containing protein n=1 Tax=Cladobotryum mycophilum TaxID=491253 RepID=A0ABR0SMG7_9HYPO
MSPTMVVASTTTTILADRPSCCPSCGFNITPLENDPSTRLLEAQARIAELETQVCLLNQRAKAAIDRWSDYEAELTKLRAQVPPPSATTSPRPDSSSAQSPTRASLFQSGASRLSALVYPRSWQASHAPRTSTESVSTSAAQSLSSAHPTSPTQDDLLEALEREQSLRREAENRLSATSREVEELSAALFEQANEMVADERRARAKLEQRVGELEKRDADKKRRLDRLETSMDRIERVRNLLQESQGATPA